MRRGRRGVALVALAVLGMAGCSTSSGAAKSSPTTSTAVPAAPSKANYLTQANAICADMNAASIAVSREYSSKPVTAENEAALLRANADIIESTITKLRALPRPRGDEATLKSAFDKAAELPPAARALATAVEDGDQSRIPALQAAGDKAQAAANQAADSYGLTTCGSGSSSSSA